MLTVARRVVFVIAGFPRSGDGCAMFSSSGRDTIAGMEKRSRGDLVLAGQLDRMAAAETGVVTGAVPERWQLSPRWRYPNLHVGTVFARGHRGLRIFMYRYCGQVVQQTFPEDRSGPLWG